MPTYEKNAKDGYYYNCNSPQYGWMNGGSHFYAGISSAGSRFKSKIIFPCDFGDGRPVTITSAKMKLYRQDGGGHSGNITAYVSKEDNAELGVNTKVNSEYNMKTWTFTPKQREAIAAATKSKELTIFITHSSTSRMRFTGYNNGSYSADKKPIISIIWEYTKSSGTVSSNYYDQPASIQIVSADPSYTHKISWVLPNSQIYHQQILDSGTTEASCIFYGNNNTTGVSAENYGDFFNGGYSATFKVILDTYTSSGILVGSTTYNLPLNKPSSFSLGSIEDCEYDQPAKLTFIPAYPSHYHVVNWYIENNSTPLHSTLIPATNNTDAIEMTYLYFDTVSGLNPADYFTHYVSTISATVVLQTYSADNLLQGQQALSFNIIKPSETPRILVDLFPDPTIIDTSIIIKDPVLKTDTTLNNIFSEMSSYILNKARPIGSIYISSLDTNPSLMFGGDWVSYGPARTLLTTTNISEVGQTGGSFTHTLTIAQMPSHKHVMNYSNVVKEYTYPGNGSEARGGTTASNSYTTNNTGGGQPHNNTQPYQACYFWERIS